MKGWHIWSVFVIVMFSTISLNLWRSWKDEAKTDEIRAIKQEVMHSIYIDSVRTYRLLDSLNRIGARQMAHQQQLEAYNRAVRVQNQQIRKQNEKLVIEIDSLRGIINDRPDF